MISEIILFSAKSSGFGSQGFLLLGNYYIQMSMTFPVENVLPQQLSVRKENSKRNMADKTISPHYWCWILTVFL